MLEWFAPAAAGALLATMIAYYWPSRDAPTIEKTPPSRHKELSNERDFLMDQLSEPRVQNHAKLFALYEERLKAVNAELDRLASAQREGRCNVCLKEGITVLSAKDDGDSLSVCVRCIHDSLLETRAKHHWEEDSARPRED